MLETPEGEEAKVKKRKKSADSKEDGSELGTIQNKVKNKKSKEASEEKEPHNVLDVVFLSEKTGNTDEVNINQERRQSLQMEVDNASQPPAKPTWSTAEFNSSEKQQKFLRLMGGFKKGFQPASDRSGAANMALGKGAQEQLQQGLVGEFERAQSRRIDFSNRGTGLGFTPASNKKFSIDIHSSRSVRFDD
ncbi:Lysine-rich nucleolar protein 1 [Dissostichus eleginoides]|uniref:Lysine-rich nucleolar protein 1 n=1 Tax=Dissostichus eleginoides TaxID=100907 RepID=A0AAD9BLZ7_DISEL|nr:Lysine-rich nucleolar protein 1 [Dissostichus eleginoides]